MPKVAEYAEVEVNGQTFRDWTSISVERGYMNSVSAFTLQVAEKTGGYKSYGDIKLKPGDKAKLTLAGRLAITGAIATRQVAYNAVSHQLQITGLSLVNMMVQTSPETSKSEFKNYGFAQIGRTLLAPLGIELKIEGNPQGIDKPFPRFSINPGESALEAIERMMRMRNLYSHDDSSGALVVKRGGKPSEFELREGANILSASAVLSDEFALSKIEILGHAPSNDQSYGEDTRVRAEVKNPAVKGNKALSLIMEQPGDRDDAMMRGAREMAENQATMVRVQIRVQGWISGGDEIWLNEVGKIVRVVSPMLFPGDSMDLGIENVKCMQSEQGTVSELTLVLPSRLGGSARVQFDGIA